MSRLLTGVEHAKAIAIANRLDCCSSDTFPKQTCRGALHMSALAQSGKVDKASKFWSARGGHSHADCSACRCCDPNEASFRRPRRLPSALTLQPFP